VTTPSRAALPQPGRLDPGAKLVVGICTAAAGLGSATGFLWGFLVTLLRADLGVSRAAIGFLVGAFFGSTGLGSIAGGNLTDRMGARLAVTADMAIVTVVGLSVAFFQAYPMLVAAAILAGFGYALVNAGTNVAIAAVVPPARRGVTLTLRTAGVPMMATIAAFGAPWAGDRLGWSVAFVAMSALSALTAVAALRWLPDDRPSRSEQRARRRLPAGFLWFPVGAFLMINGSQALYAWIVPYLDEGLGLDLAVAGAMASAATGVATAGMVLLGRGSDRFGQHHRVRGVVVLCVATSMGIAVTAAAPVLGPFVAIVAVAIALAAQLGAIGIMHAAVVDAAEGAVGRASGVTMTGYYLGALGSPAIFGFLVDTTGTYTIPWSASAVSVLLGALAFWQVERRRRTA
jgi:predicted MFS family arabinose efflux permease